MLPNKVFPCMNCQAGNHYNCSKNNCACPCNSEICEFTYALMGKDIKKELDKKTIKVKSKLG